MNYSKRVSYFSHTAFWGCLLLVAIVFGTLTYTKPARAEVEGPIHYDCYAKRNNLGFHCTDLTAPAYTRKVFVNKYGEQYVKTVSTTIDVNCKYELCAVRGTGAPAGQVLPNRTIDVTLMDGYYVYQNADTFLHAWKIGYGPLYDNRGVSDTPAKEKDVWELYCSPISDLCTLDGQEVTREELVKYIPMANIDKEMGSTWSCSLESCIRNKDGKTFGLNPFFYN